MPRHANIFVLVAVPASVAAHVMLVSVSARLVYLPAWVAPRETPSELIVVLDTETPAEPEVEPKAPELDPELQLGTAEGVGYSSFAAEGLREQLAKLAENDQASLSLDPRGSGTGGASAVAAHAELFAQARPVPATPNSPTRSPQPPRPPLEESVPFGVVSATPLPKSVRATKSAAGVSRVEAVAPHLSSEQTGDVLPTATVKTDAPDETPSYVDQVRPPTPTVAASVPVPPPPPDEARPVGQTAASADPARASDSEVDAFASIGSVEFREGRLSVRSGRQVKPRRPKLGLAGTVSLYELRDPSIVFDVSIDAAGKVTSAEIIKATGKVELDQPTRVAMYEWWFEPKRDAAGRPVPDRFRWTIRWR